MISKIKNAYKSIVFWSMALIAGIAIAAHWGPFMLGSYFPNINFDDDANVDFYYASTVPRLVMNISVQNIKRGDTVRIMYPNGDVYDFEAAHNYAYASSANTLAAPLKRLMIDDMVVPSSVMFTEVIWPACWSGGGHLLGFRDLGAWVVSSSVSGGTTTVTAHWQSINSANLAQYC